MTITISDGTSSTSPLLVLGYEMTNETINQVHIIPGAPSPSVTLFGSTLRAGRMEILYPSTTTADAARELLCQPANFTYTDTDQTELNMSFVVTGQVSMTLDDESRLYWIVGFEFREIS